MHHWHHLCFGQIKIATWTKCYVWVFIISCELWTPHLILLCMKPLHLMHHIVHCIPCIDLCYIPLVCAFGSSRVEPEYEQFEQEYEHPQEDRACASTADLTGEPTPSPILHFHALLIYCYPYVAILLCHVSYSTCYLYIRVTPPRPTYCLLFASFASRRRV